MNTPTHMLLAAAVLARPGDKVRNWSAVFGGFLPDLPIFALFAYSKLAGIPEREVWGRLYWIDPWDTIIAIFNSIPLALLILLAGVMLKRSWLVVLAVAVLLHIATDFPVHHDDAHAHFWPFSMWKFHSPLSYWHPDYHGREVALAELVLAIGLIVVLWRQFEGYWVRTAMGVALFSYVAVPAYFILSHH